MTDTKTLTDEEIIAHVLAGVKRFFELIVRRFNEVLYKVGRSYNFELEDTKDLMQETFINAYQHLAQFEHRSSFKTWLVRIMLNNCYRRKQQKKAVLLTGEEVLDIAQAATRDVYNNTEKRMQRKELGQLIELALLHIPERYRIVFTLREVNGMSVAETANLLELTAVNVKVRLSRAKALLRKEMTKDTELTELFSFNLIHCNEIVARVMDFVYHDN